MLVVLQTVGIGNLGCLGGIGQIRQAGGRQFTVGSGVVLSGDAVIACIDGLVAFGSGGVLFSSFGVGLGDLCVHLGNLLGIHHGGRGGGCAGGQVFHGRQIGLRGLREFHCIGLGGQGHGHGHGNGQGAARSGQGLGVIHFLIFLSHNFNLL